MKLQRLKTCKFIKKDSNTGAFLWNLRNFLEHLFLQNTSGGCFWTSINPIPDFTIEFASPDGQSSNIGTIWEKIKIQSFKDNNLQNLRENISEIFDPQLVNFKAQCEDLRLVPTADKTTISND